MIASPGVKVHEPDGGAVIDALSKTPVQTSPFCGALVIPTTERTALVTSASSADSRARSQVSSLTGHGITQADVGRVLLAHKTAPEPDGNGRALVIRTPKWFASSRSGSRSMNRMRSNSE